MSDARPAVTSLGQPLDFLRVIWAFDQALQRTSQRMEAELGVTAAQRMVVRIVGRFPGISAGELAEILHTHPSTVTGLLKRLATKKLITRKADPNDRRRVLVGLTEKGRGIDVETAGSVEAAIVEAFAQVDPKAIAGARAAMIAITHILSPPDPETAAPRARRSARGSGGP